MLQKLIANRLLDLPAFDQLPPAADATFPADFAPVPNRIYNTQESTNAGSFFNRIRSSRVVDGAHDHKGHRTFRWLPWVAGKVSCVPLAHAPRARRHRAVDCPSRSDADDAGRKWVLTRARGSLLVMA
jgi:hypothetical protein